jgi:hypothetical protein
MTNPLAIRWTVGDVSSRGFDALAFSVEGALAIFPGDTAFVISVNTVAVEQVRERMGALAGHVQWQRADGEIPPWLAGNYLDSAYAEGVAWKFAPVRLFPDRHELALDNDVVFWRIPPSVEAWLTEDNSTLIAEDVRPAFGAFAPLCPAAGRNSGIRGLPPGYDLEAALRGQLARTPIRLTSELDEQGLQVAVLTSGNHHVTTLAEVSICSPVPPHLRDFGSCGAHFVGVNAKKLPWEWNGKSGEEYVQEHWDQMLPRLRAAVGGARRARHGSM